VLIDEFSTYGDNMKPMGKKDTDDCIDSWMLAMYPFLDNKITFHSYVIGGDEDAQKTYSEYDEQKKQSGYYHGLSRAF